MVNDRKLFIYDLEFIGDIHNIDSCKIWDMSFLCVETGERISSIVEPDKNMEQIPPPVVEGLFPLTREFLNEHNALSFYTVWTKMLSWIMKRSYQHNVILVSHNNFLSDKPILENHIQWHKCYMPEHIYFYDSLLFYRDNIKTNDYSLKGLVKLILNKEHKHAHRADIDTIRLHECLKNTNISLNGFVFPLHVNSLRTIKGIGMASEHILMHHGIQTREQLVKHIIDNDINIVYSYFINTSVSLENVETIKSSLIKLIYEVL